MRERYVRERGGRYDEEVQRAMMGMSSAEWSRYLHEHAGVPDSPEAINAEVVRRMLDAYRERAAARRRRASRRCGDSRRAGRSGSRRRRTGR